MLGWGTHKDLFWPYDYWGVAKFNLPLALHFSKSPSLTCRWYHYFYLKQKWGLTAKGARNIWLRCDYLCGCAPHKLWCDREPLGIQMPHPKYPLCLWIFLELCDEEEEVFILIFGSGSLQKLPVTAAGRLWIGSTVYYPIYLVLFTFKINF